MDKQNQYRFNLSFDEADEDHRRVCDYLNACGRKKARYVVKAILAYWALQEGQYAAVKPQQAADRADTLGPVSGNTQSRVIDLDDDIMKVSLAEAELMKQNYSVFDDLE